ncbi:lipopolysaccharide biosynthesis protein [Brevundimonas sp.]|uniref:lipopolysaccharide biosynthesis protein n=1 Tax=Brevundimonas sp. TaxID=1871086 RepID=UPI002FCAFAE8
MRRQVLRGVAWVLGETLARNILLFGFTVVLARLLTPSDFGVVAMLGLFVGLASTLAEGGMGSALVQAERPTREDISTLFWTQMLLAGMLGAVLAASGPFLAGWFGQPILAPLSVAYGVNVVISAPASLQASLMLKELDFRTPAIVSTVAQLAGGVAAVVAALSAMGPWAVVVQSMMGAVVTTILLWVLSPWRPSWQFSFTSLRRYLGFGVYVVGSGILGEVEQRVGSLAIGRVAGPADTGLYQRASSLQLLLSRVLSGIVTRVAFPAFAAIRSNPDRMVSALREATFVNFVVTALIMWTVALAAGPFVSLAFGPQWSRSAGALQAMCIAGGFYPIFAVFTKALRALGHSRLVFLHYLVRALGVVVLAGLFAAQGFIIMSWAQALFLVGALLFSCWSMARHSGYALRMQLADFAPTVVAGGAMAISGLIVTRATADLSVLWQFTLVSAASVAGFLAAFSILIFLVPMPAARMAITTIQSAMTKVKRNAKV